MRPFQPPPDHPGPVLSRHRPGRVGGRWFGHEQAHPGRVLWLFAVWYLGNIVSFHLGISDLLGPILGISAALMVVADPLRILWTASDDRPSQGNRSAVSD